MPFLGNYWIWVYKSSILNDNERKKQILQVEILYPELSYIGFVLQKFKTVVLLDLERESKRDCISSSQLFFSFVVIISHNESVFQKYCPLIIEIVDDHLKLSFEMQSDSSSYMIHICNLVFSVRYPFWVVSKFIESILITILPERCHSVNLFSVIILFEVFHTD